MKEQLFNFLTGHPFFTIVIVVIGFTIIGAFIEGAILHNKDNERDE